MLFARAQYKLPRRKLCRYRSKLEHLNTHTQPPEASKPTDYYQTWINLCRRKYLCPLVSQIRSALRANVPPEKPHQIQSAQSQTCTIWLPNFGRRTLMPLLLCILSGVCFAQVVAKFVLRGGKFEFQFN